MLSQQRSNGRALRVAAAWDLVGGAENTPVSLQQLTEARFLAAFCCAVYGQHEPKQVCATAAQWLYEYFGYRLAHFSFAGVEVESVTFRPGSKANARPEPGALLPVYHPGFSKRGISTGSARGVGADIPINLPKGRGTLHIIGAEQVRREPSGDFLHSIADCLGSALEKALERGQLKELALRDGLTGLLNRRAFEELLGIEEGRRDTPVQSLIMIDIDNFKSINDRFGHLTGDQVIAGVGGIIKETLRSADIATRYGGEEFAVLLPNTTQTDAVAVAERIRSRVASLKFNFPGRAVQVTASLGVANRQSKEQCSLRELLALADESLYRAKRSGKNTTQVHQSGSHRQ